MDRHIERLSDRVRAPSLFLNYTSNSHPLTPPSSSPTYKWNDMLQHLRSRAKALYRRIWLHHDHLRLRASVRADGQSVHHWMWPMLRLLLLQRRVEQKRFILCSHFRSLSTSPQHHPTASGERVWMPRRTSTCGGEASTSVQTSRES